MSDDARLIPLKQSVDKMTMHIRSGDRAPIDDRRLANALSPVPEAQMILKERLSKMTNNEMLDFLDGVQRTTPDYPWNSK